MRENKPSNQKVPGWTPKSEPKSAQKSNFQICLVFTLEQGSILGIIDKETWT